MSPVHAIQGSVGAQGKNARSDVRVVQLLLNTWLSRVGRPLLDVDGTAGPLTCQAISSCQRALHLPVVDGRVDPNGPTLKALGKLCLETLSMGLQASATPAYRIVRGSMPLPIPDPMTALWMVLAGSHHIPH